MKRTVALLTCLALMIPGAAIASANATGSGYGHPAVKSVTSSHSGPSSNTSPGASPSASPTAGATTTQTGSLPFTGLDVGGLAAGALLLLGSGLVLRRVSAKNRS